MKKHIIMPAAILLYAIIMAALSYKQTGMWTNRMTIMLIVELAITILLYILLKKRYDNSKK
ncbi:MAG: hypothetical protein U0L19_04160 [Bacteroidales bacterium]|nr:hypothetical protein [Bacteroidales bacterium]